MKKLTLDQLASPADSRPIRERVLDEVAKLKVGDVIRIHDLAEELKCDAGRALRVVKNLELVIYARDGRYTSSYLANSETVKQWEALQNQSRSDLSSR